MTRREKVIHRNAYEGIKMKEEGEAKKMTLRRKGRAEGRGELRE